MNLQKDSNKDSGEISKSKVVKIQQKKKKRKKKKQTLLLGLHCLGLVFWQNQMIHIYQTHTKNN